MQGGWESDVLLCFSRGWDDAIGVWVWVLVLHDLSVFGRLGCTSNWALVSRRYEKRPSVAYKALEHKLKGFKSLGLTSTVFTNQSLVHELNARLETVFFTNELFTHKGWARDSVQAKVFRHLLYIGVVWALDKTNIF